MDIRGKAAYVKGLLDGLELDEKDKQTKLLSAVVALLQDVADDISNLEQSYDDVCDQIDALDDTVASLEEEFDNELWDLDSEDEYDDEDYDDDENAEYEFTCPTCGKTVVIDGDTFNLGSMICPGCGQELEFDLSDDDNDEDDELQSEPKV